MSKDAVDTATAASRTDVARTPADAGDAGYALLVGGWFAIRHRVLKATDQELSELKK